MQAKVPFLLRWIHYENTKALGKLYNAKYFICNLVQMSFETLSYFLNYSPNLAML